MNKLREKFERKANFVFYGDNNFLPTKIKITSEQCEQITDDFSLKFAEWCDSNYSVQKQDFNELLQIFKTQYYGKE